MSSSWLQYFHPSFIQSQLTSIFRGRNMADTAEANVPAAGTEVSIGESAPTVEDVKENTAITDGVQKIEIIVEKAEKNTTNVDEGKGNSPTVQDGKGDSPTVHEGKGNSPTSQAGKGNSPAERKKAESPTAEGEKGDSPKAEGRKEDSPVVERGEGDCHLKTASDGSLFPTAFYCSPQDAVKNGPREKIAYVICVQPDPVSSKRHDYLATVDVDPTSCTYSKVISRLLMPNIGDELHHFGWNACSSCHGDGSKQRKYLILPALASNRIYVVDVLTNPTHPQLHKTIELADIQTKCDVTAMHTVHCLYDGNIMVSSMGNGKGEHQGALVLIDGSDFSVKGYWSDTLTAFGYDFWYQPRHNVMVSSGWGAPNAFSKGLVMDDITNGLYNTKLYVWDWKQRTLLEEIELGSDGLMPLEVRFLHDPTKKDGFVGCALGSNVFRFHQDCQTLKWRADKVIEIPSKKVTNWAMDAMPGVISDILISMDDRFLFVSTWLFGVVSQYDISNTSAPRLVGQIQLGGSIGRGLAQVVDPSDPAENDFEGVVLKGRRIEGGPQMLQLSLDGKRLYVTNSLYSHWDKQFYPNMLKFGSHMIGVNVDCVKGGLTLNSDFGVDFGAEPGGSVLAHEVRYPGGDCTSDIFL